MGATNYFKCAGAFFFFDERDRASVDAAFDAARATQDALTAAAKPNTYPDPICVWQRLRLAGPWDYCREVGESVHVHEVGEPPPRQWS
jgi:hypothetical protein